MRSLHEANENTTFVRDGDTLSIAGEIDVAVVDEFGNAMRALIEANPGVEVCVDLRDVNFIDSSGLGVLVGANKQAAAAGATIRLAHVQASPAKVFEITGLQSSFGLG